jgi:fructose-1,6-bisphosphatase II
VEDREREIMLDFVRVTETAALRAARVLGRGDKEAVDQAAVDGMRGMLDLVNINGKVVIGEGEKDKAPMLYIGEQVGKAKGAEPVDIAVDPVEGTRLVACGLPNAISAIVAADEGCLLPVPGFYMEKIAVGPQASGYIDLEAPVRENLRVVAAALGKNVRDLTVVVLDRERHRGLMDEIRCCGARIKMILDGDVAGAIATALPETGVDILMGIGGAPEAVLAAAALRCLGGELQTKLYTPTEEVKAKAREIKLAPDDVLTIDDLVKGESVIFAATGITDGELLKGVRYGPGLAKTHSLVMRERTKTVRFVETIHNLKYKTVRSRKEMAELEV